MSTWVLLLVGFAVLWLLWLTLGALFDRISSYQRKPMLDTAHGVGPWKPRETTGNGGLSMSEPRTLGARPPKEMDKSDLR